MTRSRAATLLELMVVVALLGIAATLAVSNLQGVVASSRVRGAAEATAALLRSARSQAIAQHALVLVDVNAGVVSLRLCRAAFGVARCATSPVSVTKKDEMTLLRAVSLADVGTGVAVTGAPASGNEFVFGPDGIPTGTSAFDATKTTTSSLSLTFAHSDAGRTLTVNVSSAGEVSVE